ncbi:MAG: DinB family protein [Thermomicrobiales bacterium]
MIRTLYGYSQWATGRVLDATAQLSPEQLHAPGDAGRGSIRDTLLHMLATQRSWLIWWDGSLPPEEDYRLRLDPADFPEWRHCARSGRRSNVRRRRSRSG